MGQPTAETKPFKLASEDCARSDREARSSVFVQRDQKTSGKLQKKREQQSDREQRWAGYRPRLAKNCSDLKLVLTGASDLQSKHEGNAST